MRILLVSQYYYPERTPSFIVAEELQKLGHEVTVLTGKPNYGFKEPLEEYKNVSFEVVNGVKVHRVKASFRKKGILSLIKNYLSFSRLASKFLRKLKPNFDLVLGINLSPITSLKGASKYVKKHHLPFAIYVLDLWPESVVATGITKRNSLFYKFLFKYSRNIYKSADGFLYSSPSFDDYMKNVIGVNCPSKLVYQPLNTSSFKDISSPFKEGEKPLVYCGNLGRLQDLSPLIKAFSKLEKNSRLSLHIIGDGALRNKLEEESKKYHLEERVIFHGFMEASKAYRYSKNAFANVVKLETTDSAVSKTIPTKLIYSLYLGRPILSLIGDDGKNLLKEAGGAFFPMENEDSLIKELTKIENSSVNEISLMGKKNEEYYLEHLSTNKTMLIFESFLRALYSQRNS